MKYFAKSEERAVSQSLEPLEPEELHRTTESVDLEGPNHAGTQVHEDMRAEFEDVPAKSGRR